MTRLIRTTLLLAVAALMSVGLCADRAVSYANLNETPVTPGELVIVTEGGKQAGACPLKHTDVDAEISGFIARVTVTQQFHNPTGEKIEAVYTFPLPQDSAVDRMEMKVGERTIVGEIHPREEAREIYEAAKASGHVAGLLDQQRPNIFTQAVANITPGAEVTITISYTQLLKYEAGDYEFVFPMVVGPRFIHGESVGHEGTGTEDDTTSVPDASKISPPMMPKGTRAGHDISLAVRIEAGVPIYSTQSILHDADYEFPSATSAVVTLKDKNTIQNKDFVLKYSVAGEMVQSGAITHAPGGGMGYFALVVQPPKSAKPKFITPKEMIFVIDTSGSQSGEPIKKSKETMVHCIKNTNPGDTFNMIAFANDARKLFDRPRTFNRENEKQALEFLDKCEASGGTNVLGAIRGALTQPADPNRLRIVVFFTDGYIGNDFEILDCIQKDLGSARIFGFGIGNSVNRFLIEKMSELGRGVPEFVLLSSDGQQVAQKFYDRIRNPLITDVSIDWNGLPIATDEVYPKRIPDLFTAKPLVLKGYYTAPASGEIIIRGNVAGEPWAKRVQVDLPENQPFDDSLASIWARAKVDDLMNKDWMGAQTGEPDASIREQIVDLALEYDLMTQYTSFVAVETMTITDGDTCRTIAVPVEMPEGLEKGCESVDGVCFGGVARYARGSSALKAASAPGASTSLGYGYSDGRVTNGSMELNAGEESWLGEVDGDKNTDSPGGEAATGESAAGDKPIEEPAEEVLQRKADKRIHQLYTALQNAKVSSAVIGIDETIPIIDNRVQVMIWLGSDWDKAMEEAKAGEDSPIKKLEEAGLEDHQWALEGKMLIGWVDIDKLADVARLDLVARMTLPDFR